MTVRPRDATLPPLTFGHQLDDAGFETRAPTPLWLQPLTIEEKSAAAETRIVDSKTGGEKGQKLERFDLIPVEPWRALAELYGVGSKKYADDNWRRGYAWRLSIGALQRHLAAWLSGKSYDTADGTKGGRIDVDAAGKAIHTGSHHLINVAWHCFALFIFETHKLGTDDRAPTVDV